MTDKQPNALRLANELETNSLHLIAIDIEAAAELRRLYEENQKLKARAEVAENMLKHFGESNV